jgi:acetyl esterase/lipase
MASEAMNKLREMINTKGLHFNEKMDILALRAMVEQMTMNMPDEPGVSFTSCALGGIEAELSMPDKQTGDDIILYIHGGGLLSGNARSSRGYASMLAATSGLRVYSISYRLIPEHPFPAGIDDCLAAYKALLEKYPHKKIALIGESGGGNLSIALALMLRDKGITLPASVTAYSPVTDMTGSMPSHKKYGGKTDKVVDANFENLLKTTYAPNYDAKYPYVSPMYADLTGFPPLKLVADKEETLADDSELFAEKAKAAGVNVQLQMWEGTFHAFATTGKGTPESAQVLEETIAFMREHFSK